jgi:hypothetical protein
MKIKQITEALTPSQYRPLVKGWDKQRYADIFTNPKYKHDKNGYRVFIPIGAVSVDNTSRIQTEIETTIQKSGFEIIDYTKGLAQKKDTKQNIKIGKLLTKLKQQELLDKFNTDATREGTKKEYMVVISRHPYDIGGQSTDRGWTSCMNLENGMLNHYVPIDVTAGTVIAYVTDKNDPDLKNPTGRLSIKPFVDILGSTQVEFGIEDIVYGTSVPGFVEAVSKWVKEINKQNKLDDVVALKFSPGLYNDGYGPKNTKVKGGSKEERAIIRSLLKNPGDIANYKTPSIAMQMAAVNTSGFSIKYIENPSPEVQLAAVTRDEHAIKHIENPSIELQMVAVAGQESVLRYINNPSIEVQMAALKTDASAIKYINNPPLEVQIAAVKSRGEVIKFINNPSLEVQMAAVKKRGEAIKYINDPSLEVQMAAVKNNKLAVHYIDNPSPEVRRIAAPKAGDGFARWR